MPDLTIVVSSLTRAHRDYKRQADGGDSKGRKARDDQFEALMSEVKKKESSEDPDVSGEFLEKICDFYVKHKSSGFLWSTPTLIKFIEQALYRIFEVTHPPSTNSSTDPDSWTDKSRKILDTMIEQFKTDREKSRSEGIRMRIFS